MAEEQKITITVTWVLDDWTESNSDTWVRYWKASDGNQYARAGEVTRDCRGYWWCAWGPRGGADRGGPLAHPEQARAEVDAYLKYLAKLSRHVAWR